MAHFWIAVGALSAGLAVGMGAFGAHGLEQVLAEKQTADVYQTGAEYHMYHSLALLAVGLLALRGSTTCLQVAGWAFLVGVLLFSGSLYVLAVTGIKWLGAITPFGGTAFLIGWAALALAGWKVGR